MKQTDSPYPDSTSSATTGPAFQLRSSMLSITELELTRADLGALEQALAEKVAQAPNFFHNTPVVLALDKLQQQLGAGAFGDLMRLCKQHGMLPIAIRSADADSIAVAQAMDLLVLSPSAERHRAPARHRPAGQEAVTLAPVRQPQPQPISTAPPAGEYRPTKTIQTPIRSGQQVYAKGSDLIVLAPVSPGAELIADGNIHVYAPLRGRALAGARGNAEARIFCSLLNAELVSIAGQYKISEDLRRDLAWGQPAQIKLNGNLLNISPL